LGTVISHPIQGVCCRLTSWRSAARAPDGGPDVMTIVGAFVRCNDVSGSRRRR
jgi:hypothetical protein